MDKYFSHNSVETFMHNSAASASGGKLVVSNAFDSKETPSHWVGITPCYCDRGATPQVEAIGIAQAAIGAAITLGRPSVHLARDLG